MKSEPTIRTRVLRTILLLLVCIVAGRFVWRFMCGNRSLNFYGQVVDEAGQPIPNVEIEASVYYSFSPLPDLSRDQSKNMVKLKVYTDAQGNFEITNQVGNLMNIERFRTSATDLWHAGKPPYPLKSFGFSNDNPLPSGPKLRKVYTMRPAG